MQPYNYIYQIIDDIIFQSIEKDYAFLCFEDHIRFDPKLVSEGCLPYITLQMPAYHYNNEFTFHNNKWNKRLQRENVMFKKLHHYIEHSWEPVWYTIDKPLWDDCARKLQRRGINHTVIHSEHNSWDIAQLEQQGIKTVHWFAHAYICSEFYFNHYQKLNMVTDYKARRIQYPWLCTNRLLKQYRTDFLEMLDLSQGCYSLLNPDPNGLTYAGPVPAHSFDVHGNHSAEIKIESLNPWNTSFLHIVNETVWQDKIHFTEKVFKPIVLHQPFVVLQAPGSLSYLRSYGFKTFGDWWDESYDTIENPQQRMQAIADIVNTIGAKSLDELETMRMEMASVLEHNFRHFYENIPAICLDELRMAITIP